MGVSSEELDFDLFETLECEEEIVIMTKEDFLKRAKEAKTSKRNKVEEKVNPLDTIPESSFEITEE